MGVHQALERLTWSASSNLFVALAEASTSWISTAFSHPRISSCWRRATGAAKVCRRLCLWCKGGRVTTSSLRRDRTSTLFTERIRFRAHQCNYRFRSLWRETLARVTYVRARSQALHAYYSGTTSITRAYSNSPVPPLAIIIGILLASSLR